MENRKLRVVVLPELGGRIWSIVYKPRDHELLWQNPRIPPQKAPFGAVFDNVWCGGWEEMFPNAAPGIINGESYPDHGEVWCLGWNSEVKSRAGGLYLALQTPTSISAVLIEKHLMLLEDEPCLEIVYKLRNLSTKQLPYLFALHPAFAVTHSCRLDLPPMKLDPDPSFPGTLTGAEPQFEWPYASRGGEKVDLRTAYPSTSGEVFFLYGHDFTEGWFAITDTDERLSWGLRYASDFFRSCWIFATYGGWRDYYALLVEPSTAFPSQIEQALELGRLPFLLPRSSVESTVRFQVQEGLSRVNGVGPEGTFEE
jgi:galactose mutarotase-like enzyme